MDISTHTLTWSVTLGKWHWKFGNKISTHTLTWSVTGRQCRTGRHRQFQLTRSRGAWPQPLQNVWKSIWFQLTRSRGAWQERRRTEVNQNDFNSHAHVERDAINSRLKGWGYISTHTLTWSVTKIRQTNQWTRHISTHTLTWSVTSFTFPRFLYCLISTHTLTWSVTL
mgnify:CR=1 FL=1